MFRRYLFLGLTLMLATVLVYLIIQSRRSEQEAAKKRTRGVVLESPVSATRAIAPGDLVVENCGVKLTGSPSPRSKTHGSVDLEIRNAGSTTYRNLMVRISILGRSSAVIETRQHLLRESVTPNTTFSAALIPLNDVPASATGCRAEVLYADINPAGEITGGK